MREGGQGTEVRTVAFPCASPRSQWALTTQPPLCGSELRESWAWSSRDRSVHF